MPYKNPQDRIRRQRERRAERRAERQSTLPVADVSGLPVWEVVGDWAESCLLVPSGPLRSQPFRVPQWQRDWISGAMGAGVRKAGWSMARKNGKSGAVAMLILAHLCGPLFREDWRAVVVSLTGRLAGELRDAISETAEISGLELTVNKTPTPGRIVGPGKTRVDVLASDKSSGHATGADLAIIDEGGLIPEAGRDLWNAVYSSISGRDGRLLVISIRGNSPMFEELADRADSPEVFWQEYAAQPDCDLEDREAWYAANPGLGTIKSESYMVDAARRAEASPADGRLFRSHDLNLPGVAAAEPLIEVGQWLACERHFEDIPGRDGRVVVGFDAGGSSSMTAAVAIWETGHMACWAAFPDTPDLMERGKADHVGARYQAMLERGELRVFPGRVTPVSEFLGMVADDLGDPPYAFACDYYKKDEVLDFLDKAGLKHWPVDWRRMGAGPSGGMDVRAFQRMVLDRQIACRESLLVRSALSESLIRYDANGNQGLDKRRHRGRIDVLSAAVLAAGLWERVRAEPKRRGYLGSINP